MKRVTLKDIAHKAGLSHQSVSEVINNYQKSRISVATREKVFRIVREMNYRPNYFAKTLKTGLTNCIGVVGGRAMADLNEYYVFKVIDAIEKTLVEDQDRYSFSILGLGHYRQWPEHAYDMVERHMVDGLVQIVKSTDLESFRHTLLPRLQQMDIPFVVVHSTSQGLPYNNVGFNSHGAAYLAASHFIKLQYTRVGFYLRDPQNPQVREMLEGFKKAFADHHLSWNDSSLIVPSAVDTGLNSFQAAYRAILALRELPRAVFAAEDIAAHGMLKACQARGVRVPYDLAIMGCDDEKPVEYLENNLTTVHHPFTEKGREAVLMLTKILNNELDRNSVHQKVLEPYLVFRQTCPEALPDKNNDSGHQIKGRQ